MTYVEDFHFGERMNHFEYHPENLEFAEHIHRSFELWFCEEGIFSIQIEGEKHELGPGDILLILPYQRHSIHSETATLGHIWLFAPEYIEDYLPIIQDKQYQDPVLPIGLDASHALQEQLFEVSSIYRHKAALYEVLSYYEQETTLIPSKKKDDVLAMILSWISQNYMHSKNMTDMAMDIGYSPDYISKVISKRLDSSFPDLLNQYRINYACYLLANTDLSITEISSQSGFQNIRTFNRNFQKQKDMIPKDYRKQAYKGDKSVREFIFGNSRISSQLL